MPALKRPKKIRPKGLRVRSKRSVTPKRRKPKTSTGRAGAARRDRMRNRPKRANLQPRPFQIEAVEQIERNNFQGAIFDAMGLGKTITALTTLKRNPNRTLPALIVCPSSVAWNWEIEARDWIPGVRVHAIEGMEDPLPKKMPHVVICPWDLLHYRESEIANMLPWKMIVADEAHYARNGDTKRGRAFRNIAQQIPGRLILTGTPILNGRNEMDSLLAVLDGGKPLIIRRLLEDVADDVPPKSRRILTVSMPEGIKAEYDELIEDFEGWLHDYLGVVLGADKAEAAAEGSLSAEALAKVVYLRRCVGRGKVPAAAAWALGKVKQGEPVVIFGEHSDVLDYFGQAMTAFGIRTVRIDGSTPRKQRQEAIDLFQSGRVPVFIGSQAAREGITLTAAAHTLFLERWFIPAYEEQAEDRTHRIGQKRPTTMWYVHAEDTYDLRVSEIVDSKRLITERNLITADVDSKEVPGVVDVWQRIGKIKGLVKPLRREPKARREVPVIPHSKRLFALYYNPSVYPTVSVRNRLKQQGLHVYSVKSKRIGQMAIVRKSRDFRPGSMQVVTLGAGLQAVYGAPYLAR